MKNIKLTDVMRAILLLAVVYNMIIVPLSVVVGFPFPPIIIDEAVKILMMFGGISG